MVTRQYTFTHGKNILLKNVSRMEFVILLG